MAAIWAHATEVRPAFYEPIHHGWTHKYEPRWFQGSQTPNQLYNILLSTSENTNPESDNEDDLNLTESIRDDDSIDD